MSSAITNPKNVALPLCDCLLEKQAHVDSAKPIWKSKKLLKMLAMYATMVVVSTTAIFFLEHSTLINAFRTALVAAIGKTVAANWVCGIFD